MTDKKDRTPGLNPAQETERLNLEIARRQSEFWRFFSRMRTVLQKGLIWGVFFGIFWLLRDFFALIFVTFVFSFVSTTFAKALGRFLPSMGWKPRVVMVFSAFLLVIGLVVWAAIPQIKRGVVQLQENIQDLPDKWNSEIDPWLFKRFGFYRRMVEEEVEEVDDAESRSKAGGEETGGEAVDPAVAPADPQKVTRIIRRKVWETETFKHYLDDATARSLKNVPSFITDVVTAIMAAFSLIFLSILFSFLIVLDLDALRREVKKLEKTKINEFYDETVRNIVKFGSVLGKVLEAQAVIALVNSILTAIGLWLFDVPNVAFLSLGVFICGFIPVAGVFISSVPICLMGLYASGVGMLFILIGFITGIHFLEAYVLNPRIMGAALHVNPVLVLVILVIGHHAMGVWGFLLGLPIAYYFFTHVIKREDREIGLRASLRRRRGGPEAPEVG